MFSMYTGGDLKRVRKETIKKNKMISLIGG